MKIVTPKQLEALRILSRGTAEEKARISSKTYYSLAARFLATYNERGITATGQSLLNMKDHFRIQKSWANPPSRESVRP